MGFQPKTVCNVKEVEFARAVKLNKTSIDLITFQVPRVKVSVLNHHAEQKFCGMVYTVNIHSEHFSFTPYKIVQLLEKIHTHPMKGHQKLGVGGLKSQTF